MRLLFLILAHDRPEQTVELAQTLVEAARDGVAMIHYDRRSAAAELAVLRRAAAAEPRLRLVEKRVACRWGGFGLVEAPLNALAQAEAEGILPDYVILLSGACLPCRPVAQLERYLEENAGTEFIEVAGAEWVGNGWRSERWRYRFWFDHKTQHPLEWLFFQIQRLLGIERRFPEGLTPRFGSQWWALTWDTAQAMLLDMRRAPGRLRFFRSVWIPDEMVVQTYVHALVPADEIAGHGLTHFQFSNRGKPVVYHDDHVDYVRTLNGFFLRKVAPGAARLRAACLAVARGADDGGPLEAIGTRRGDYRVKVAAQTYYPVPGQIFYRDQQADMTDTVLAAAEAPYVVLIGPPALTRVVAGYLPASRFTRLGEVFAPGEVDLGPDRDAARRARARDTGLRDLHPALFLARLRARCPSVPVLLWSPFHQPELLEAVLRDPKALVVACLPFTGDEPRDRRLLALACRPEGLMAPVPERASRHPAGAGGAGAGRRPAGGGGLARLARQGPLLPDAGRSAAAAQRLHRAAVDPRRRPSRRAAAPPALRGLARAEPLRRATLVPRPVAGIAAGLGRSGWRAAPPCSSGRCPGSRGSSTAGARRRSGGSRRRARAGPIPRRCRCRRTPRDREACGAPGRGAAVRGARVAGPRRRAAAQAGAGPPRADRARRHPARDLPAQRAGADARLRRPLPRARGGAFPGDRQRLDRRLPRMGGGEPDVSVWYTEASYKASAFGMLWCNDLLRRHAHNRWCVVVDPDELLVYPRMETRDFGR